VLVFLDVHGRANKDEFGPATTFARREVLAFDASDLMRARVRRIVRDAVDAWVGHDFARLEWITLLGHWAPFSWNAWPSCSALPLARSTAIVSAAIRDISERRLMEATANLLAQRLRSAVDSIQDAFVLFDNENRPVLCNSAYRALVGVSPVATTESRAHASRCDRPDLRRRARPVPVRSVAHFGGLLRDRDELWSRPTFR
jgi:PAS domain-containing protein